MVPLIRRATGLSTLIALTVCCAAALQAQQPGEKAEKPAGKDAQPAGKADQPADKGGMMGGQEAMGGTMMR